MTFQFIAAQALGGIAIILFIISFQIKSNRGLFYAQSAGCLTYCLQYLCLGAYTGCISEITFIIRNMLMTKYNECAWVRWRGWIAVFSLACIIITIFTWDGFKSLFIMITGIVGAYSMWSNNAKTIRILNLFVISPSLIVYNIICGAYLGVVNELIIISSVLISIFRYGWAELGDPNSDFQTK